MSRSRDLFKGYQVAATVVTTLCLLFVLMNLVVALLYGLKTAALKKRNPLSSQYGRNFERVYPGLAPREFDQLMYETWTRPYVYEPYTQFKERPYSGQYVNVSPQGFRHTKNQGSWPPDPAFFNIFLFGGSTTFNYGLPDDQTIASYLQEFLRRDRAGKPPRVYNFGRGYYFSPQERILFERLVAAGHLPDLALFLDGQNEFFFTGDDPAFTPMLDRFLQDDSGFLLQRLVQKLPLSRAVRSFRAIRATMLAEAPDGRDADRGSLGDGRYDDPKLLQHVIERYARNKAMIEAVARTYGVDALFVWEPAPNYGYDLKYHLFAEPESQWGLHAYAKSGYPMMARMAKRLFPERSFAWCADVQEGVAEPLYVDSVHYTAAMSVRVARCIVAAIEARHLLPSR